MESNSNYDSMQITSWDLVLFGTGNENTYSGLDPKVAIIAGRCCKFLHEIFSGIKTHNDYWKRHVFNEFKYKNVNPSQIGAPWKNLFCDYSKDLNIFLNDCLKTIKISNLQTTKSDVFTLLKPHVDSFSKPNSNPKGQYVLAECYYSGHGVPQDKVKAFEFYKFSADQGFAPAQNKVAWYYWAGFVGVEKNNANAFKYYKLSSDQLNAEGLLGLAECYQKGCGVEKNYAKSVECYLLSAIHGNAEAQWKIGFCYETGSGIEKNDLKAFKYYELSANQGYESGLLRLADCYQMGVGVDEDLSLAIKYYKLAAEKGSSFAKIKLNWLNA